MSATASTAGASESEQQRAQLSSLSSSLLSSGTPLDARFRALFTLKGLAGSSPALAPEVISIIGKGFADDSALLKHELAYCLGQIADLRAVPTLEAVVRDLQQDVMVRHEAAEALGAISSRDSLPLLREHEQQAGEDVSVRETCELAIRKIEWDHSEEGKRLRAEETQRKQQAKEAGDGGHEWVSWQHGLIRRVADRALQGICAHRSGASIDSQGIAFIGPGFSSKGIALLS